MNLPGSPDFMKYNSPLDLDGNPEYKSYQEHFEDLVNFYYYLWSPRHQVTIMVLKDKLGIYVEPGIMTSYSTKINIYSIDWEPVMSALRMHGIDVEYCEDGKSVRIVGEK